jgi:hypothetical protein
MGLRSIAAALLLQGALLSSAAAGTLVGAVQVDAAAQAEVVVVATPLDGILPPQVATPAR